MSRYKDLTGQIFDRLTAIECVGKDAFNNARWRFRCDCGNEVTARGSEVTRGGIRSCGCLVADASRAANCTHDKARTRVYKVWIAMRRRCENPKDASYSEYGERGITVCDRWRDFEAFLEDMGEPEKGQSIDRINNNGGYSPDNCRWATASDQHRNKRTSKRWFVKGTEYPTAKAAADALGVAQRTIITWCHGYTCRGRIYPPKPDCYAEARYGV